MDLVQPEGVQIAGNGSRREGGSSTWDSRLNGPPGGGGQVSGNLTPKRGFILVGRNKLDNVLYSQGGSIQVPLFPVYFPRRE